MSTPSSQPGDGIEACLPQVIDRGEAPPAYIIEENQVDNIVLPSFPPGTTIPFSAYITDDWHSHFEWCNIGFDPSKEKKKYFKWFFNPMSYYLRICPSIIDGSLLKEERPYIGAGNFHYFTDRQEIYVQYWGFLTREQCLERGIDPNTRKGAPRKHHDVFDHLNRHLGVRRLICASSIPALQKVIEDCGWKRFKPKKLKDHWDLFVGTFPLSLYQREVPYEKIYTY